MRYVPIAVVLALAVIAARVLPDHRHCGPTPLWVWVLPFVVFVGFYAYLRWRVR